VEPGFPSGIVVINEIMYNTETGKPEWVELVNVSGVIINIKNWSISDVLTTPTKSFITNIDVILQPDEYIVIALLVYCCSAHVSISDSIAYHFAFVKKVLCSIGGKPVFENGGYCIGLGLACNCCNNKSKKE